MLRKKPKKRNRPKLTRRKSKRKRRSKGRKRKKERLSSDSKNWLKKKPKMQRLVTSAKC